ncbi:MAG: NAD(P)-dependent dehydrogenase (short-subunit alcohol dehydrogenase family) [Shewanella sp.]|jgi:NAD(P)-dependent dehydrogenase (short-subunit alcohol dehydrogenase family)
MTLSGKTIIITGACGNVGAAATDLFYQHGANLVLVDLHQDSLEQLALNYAPERCQILAGDLSLEQTNMDMAVLAIDTFGRLDGFLANAAIEGAMGPIGTAKVEDFDRVMAVNVRSVWLGVKHVSNAMKGNGGSVVITSSIGGITGSPMVSAYITSKHAVVGIMRALSMELGSDNIRVNSIHPCGIEGRMIEGIAKMLPAGAIEASLTRQAFPRLVTPDEVAKLMRFLISDESLMCTGACYNVDGGYST